MQIGQSKDGSGVVPDHLLRIILRCTPFGDLTESLPVPIGKRVHQRAAVDLHLRVDVRYVHVADTGHDCLVAQQPSGRGVAVLRDS